MQKIKNYLDQALFKCGYYFFLLLHFLLKDTVGNTFHHKRSSFKLVKLVS